VKKFLLVVILFSGNVFSAQLQVDTNQGHPVINGDFARFSQFPDIVSLQTPNRQHFCGGSVIANGWVLTAAHCVINQNTFSFGVYYGDDDIGFLGQGGFFQVQQIIIHSQYDHQRIINDVALLRVPGVRKFSSTGIASAGLRPAKNELVTVAGWGQIDRFGGQTLNLRSSNLRFLNENDCRNEFSQRTFGAINVGSIGPWNVCAGDPSGFQSACRGDSGGPLYVSEGGRTVQVGVVSWGRVAQFGVGCGSSGEPGVFASVPFYRDWIERFVPEIRRTTNSNGDRDGDGVPDLQDAFPDNSRESVDSDGDGVGNNADTDDDNDGFADANDLFPLDPRESRDNDRDGVGDNLDSDDDNDGMSDAFESRHGLNPRSAADASLDNDGDGLTNLDEFNLGSDPNQRNQSNQAGLVEFVHAWTETSEEADSVFVKVQRVGNSRGRVTAQYRSFASENALARRDIVTVSGQITWADGELGVKRFEIPMLKDDVPEAEHDFEVSLEIVEGDAALGLSHAVVVIRNDDFQSDGEPLPGVLSRHRAPAVGESLGFYELELGRFRGSDGRVTVEVLVESGTANLNEDFRQPTDNLVVWEDGESGWRTVRIPIVDDGIAESSETFNIRLRGSNGLRVREQSLTGVMIHDNDSPKPAEVRFARPFFYALESSGVARVNVLRAQSNSAEKLYTVGFTDTAGLDDFVQEIREVIFSFGQISAPTTVDIIADNDEEIVNHSFLETFPLVLSRQEDFSDFIDFSTVVLLDREDANSALDTDNDGIIDFADLDDDNDGVRDWFDDLPRIASETRDSDFDGTGDNADTDDDNDGVADNLDQFPLDPTKTSTPRLANISTRGLIGTDSRVLIGGLIITGSEPKNVVIRARSRSLRDADPNLRNLLSNPSVQLFSGATLIASNDDWQSDPDAASIPEVLRPRLDDESALFATLDPGPYTAIVSGVSQTEGVGIVEIFEIDSTGINRLSNISTRGFVGEGDNVLIGGIIIEGDENKTVTIRARGPSLIDADPNLTGLLTDPLVQLFDSSGQLIDSNDDWFEHSAANSLREDLRPSRSKEAAIVRSLAPGAYTAVVRGANNASGIGIVEVFEE
jgi:hypothetical protein